MKYLGIAIAFAALLFAPPLMRPAQAACVAPVGNAGDIVYNTDQKVFQYCKDTAWERMNKPGTGAGPCANPAAAEGDIVYNVDNRVLQGCAGNTHQAFGPVGGGTGWTTIASTRTGNRTCGIDLDGKMLCWGSQMQGEMGLNDGSIGAGHSVPQYVSGNAQWIAVSTEYTHTCGIKTDGSAWCWGADNYGQLGNGAVVGSKDVPQAVTGGGTWARITATTYSTCGIKSDGTAWCWGRGNNGVLGNGATADQPNPVAVSTAGVSGTAWTRIAGGSEHVCGIRDDNTAWCWGNGFNGARGDGSTSTSQTTPVAVSGGFTWSEIYAGTSYTCGIRTTGAAYCWGTGTGGWIGDGGTSNRTTPALVSGGGSWLSLSVGNNPGTSGHTCGIKSDNLAYCWGVGNVGQLGNNAQIASQTTPLQVTIAGGPWVQIEAGQQYTCGRRADGLVNCWGESWGGGHGTGIGAETEFFFPYKIAGSPWRDISTNGDGFDFSCGVKTDGTGWCWGDNGTGQLGINSSLIEIFPQTQIFGGGTWLKISTGGGHACGIKSDNLAYCWGMNFDGQLGDGTNVYKNAPVLVAGGGSWKNISSGVYHTCGIRSNDTLWCWGDNWGGQLGDNTTGDKNAPVQVTGGGSWKSVFASYSDTCGIKSDDTLWCWGYGNNGELGQGAFASSLVPVQVAGGGTWKSVDSHCGIKTDSTGWCWGYGGNGQIGNGSYADSNVPVQLGGQWLSLSSGSEASCGVMVDGTLWCWGVGGWPLGNNDQLYDDQLFPYPVWGGGRWKKVDSGYDYSCAIDKNDEAWCWGYEESALGLEDYPVSLAGQPMNCPGAGGKPGTIMYNTDESVLQYCDGAGWVGIGYKAPVADPCAGSPAAGTVCSNGSVYAGLSPDGNVKMFTTPADAGGFSWNNGNSSGYVATTRTSNTTGEANTAAIILVDADSGVGGTQPHQAAQQCADLNAHGQTDWYLPARNELNVLYTNRAAIGGFNTSGAWPAGLYWSSSEIDVDEATGEYFNNGVQGNSNKQDSLSVRCVRK